MTLTLSQVVGFETLGLEEANSTTGSPLVDSTSPVRTGLGSLKLNGAATAPVYEIAIPAENQQLMGFAFQINDITPSSNVDFFEITGGGGTNITLRLKTDADVDVLGAAKSSVLTTISSPFTVLP